MAQHRLQRLAAPSRSFSLALHAAAIASIAYSFNFLLGWENFISESYGWHFQFLTILALSVTLLTFVLALLADLTLSPALFAAKNAVALIAAPVETVVSILYWSLQFYDPALLAPDGFELDLHIDLGFHMAPTVFLIVDLLLLSPPWTIPTYGMMGISTAAAFGYWYWVEQCFAHNGWFVQASIDTLLLETLPC